MNTARLRHSLLALSIAAAILHAPITTAAGASLNHDLSGGPLNSNLQNYGLVDLNGNGTIAPGSPSTFTYGAQFTGLTADQLRNNGAIRIDGANHGVGINLGVAGATPTTVAYNVINKGSIAVHGLAGSGSSAGISDIGSTFTGSLLNDGVIDVSGETASGVMLVHTL